MSLGLDIGAGAVKMVELRRTIGGFTLVGAARRGVAFPAKAGDEAEARAVKEASPANGVPRRAVIGLTGRDLHLQLLMYDQVPLSNYRQLIGFEMNQKRDSAPDQLIEGVLVHVPDLELPQYLTIIGSARAEWVEARMEAARRAGLLPVDVVPNGAALFALYRHVVTEPSSDVAALLDIGAANMELVLVRGRELMYMRNVSSGARIFEEHIHGHLGKSLADAEALKVRHGTLGGGEDVDPEIADELRPVLRGAAAQLAGVIHSSMNYARTQLQDRTLKIGKLYLTGGGGRLRGLVDYLRGTMKMEIETLDPLAGIDLGRFGPEIPEDLKQLPSDLACAMGLAMLAAGAEGGPVLSLVPGPLKKKREFRRHTIWLILAAVAAGLLMSVMTLSALGERMKVGSAAEALEARVQADLAANGRMEELTAALGESAAKTGRLRRFADPGRILLESLSRLRRRMPKGLSLREVKLRPLEEAAPPAFGGPVEGMAPPGPMILEMSGELRANEREQAVSGLAEVAGWLGGEGVKSEVSRVVPRGDRPGWWLFAITVEFGGATP